MLDSGNEICGVAGEIIAHMTIKHWDLFAQSPVRLTAPDAPEATSPALTKDYHIHAKDIANAAAKMLDREIDTIPLENQRTHPHDVAGDWFSGPF